MQTNYQEKVAKNARKNYDIFIQGELKTSKEDIIGNAYKISFYNSMLDYLEEEFSDLGEDMFEFLAKYDDYVLDVLYSEYIDREFVSVNTHEDINDFIQLLAESKNTETSNEKQDIEM